MKVKRAQKIFNPMTGERKYVKIEMECKICGHSRVVTSDELHEAVQKTRLFVAFRCGNCRDPQSFINVHKTWFQFHRYSYDLFPPW